MSKKTGYVILFLRLAVAASYLSSVSSRFGFWGEAVGWGHYSAFLEYAAKINWFLPGSLVPVLGRIVDIAEISLALLLIVGFRVREAAFLSGVTLLLFALGMIACSDIGLISTLDHSVLTACAASFLLIFQDESPFSLDAWLKKRSLVHQLSPT